MIYSGPHIGHMNPIFQTPRAECISKGDYDKVDLLLISEDYRQRTKYSIACSINEYYKYSPKTNWKTPYIDEYKLVTRKMLNLKQERTLISAIVPPKTGHINGIYGICCKDLRLLVLIGGLFSSLPYDFLIKSIGKTNFLDNIAKKLPLLDYIQAEKIIIRVLLLNCLTNDYILIWKKLYKEKYNEDNWTKEDDRLSNKFYKDLTSKWCSTLVLRSDFERRQAGIEIDVLVSIMLGLELNDLKTIYRIQFPVLQSYEANTWYDQNGRIVFTNNRSLTNVGFTRKEFEEIKEAKSGTFSRTITDDTMPGGPIERTIEYVAPFDCCDREKDYETAWKFFEEKFKNV